MARLLDSLLESLISAVEASGEARTKDSIENDDLRTMWEQQEAFMRLLNEKRNFPDFPVDLEQKSGQKHVKEVVQDCVTELYEALFELRNAKNHRLTDVRSFDREKFLEEIVDSQHFLFEVLILSGISREEFYGAYIAKGEINVRRINEGY